MAVKDHVVGDWVRSRKGGFASISHPVVRGLVTNWDDMELVWNYTFFDELRVEPSECNIFLTDTPLCPKADRARTAETMFNQIGVAALFLASQPSCALHSCTDLTTGLVIDIGAGVTTVVPFHNGSPITNAIQRINLAGFDLDEFMRDMLEQRGHSFTDKEMPLISTIKECNCYVALDFESEMAKGAEALKKDHELYDGQSLHLDTERIRCPEVLFRPSLAHMEILGIQESCFTAISQCDIGLRKELFENMVLVGGSTNFPGLAERLQREMSALAPTTVNARVTTRPNPRNCTWWGACTMASQPDLKWITEEEYNECGPAIVHTKCSV
ncbi:actin, cytoplasmic 2 [Pelomyxa schiedti]|nr:actin, cytoplasmic 2 [Pelomyxa schiedti]